MSSRKVPEVIFGAKAGDNYPNIIWDNDEDLKKYLTEHAGERLFIHIEPEAQLSEKMQMYAFLHKVIYPCAVIGYTACGYEGVDNVKADFMLRAEFAKDFVKKPNGEYQVIVLDKRNMTNVRLHKFMSDCIFFIENDLQTRVPDSETYKLNKATGNNFEKVD